MGTSLTLWNQQLQAQAGYPGHENMPTSEPSNIPAWQGVTRDGSQRRDVQTSSSASSMGNPMVNSGVHVNISEPKFV